MENKQFLTYRWLVGILITLLFITAGAWISSQSNRVAVIEGEHRVNEPRIATLEANLQNIIQRLERIENKLDR